VSCRAALYARALRSRPLLAEARERGVRAAAPGGWDGGVHTSTPENEGSERRRVSASADVAATARAYAPGRRAATEGAVALAGRSGPV